MALAMTTIDGEPLHVLVVCDGVSNSDGGDRASRAAAEATRDALGEAINAGSFDPEKALTEAILKAHVAVCALEPTPRRNADPPESTIVAAVVFRGVATIGWVGDSRAYWFSSDDARLLSHDHSWINEVVDAGEMTLEEAETHHEAHAITRCLGANDPDDTPEDSAPTVTTFAVPSAGRLLLCTDGLWNYAGQTDALAEVIGGLPAPADATALCRGLIDFALAQGGHDNITAVALDL